MMYVCPNCNTHNEYDFHPYQTNNQKPYPWKVKHLCPTCGITNVFSFSVYTDGGRKYRDAEWLKERYHTEGLSMKAISEMCDVSPMTIHHWLNRHGIETRARGQQR